MFCYDKIHNRKIQYKIYKIFWSRGETKIIKLHLKKCEIIEIGIQ